MFYESRLAGDEAGSGSTRQLLPQVLRLLELLRNPGLPPKSWTALGSSLSPVLNRAQAIKPQLDTV
ncbi:hypothetical protein, partial [Pseudomonas sp. NPDC089406]|uniref:hypothetical protein n=1 Tax=Pseudomonas sp. NPDC089406 TaxID=3364463 RepID=UPI00384CD7F2